MGKTFQEMLDAKLQEPKEQPKRMVVGIIGMGMRSVHHAILSEWDKTTSREAACRCYEEHIRLE